MRDPVLWFRLRVGPSDWSVLLVDSKDEHLDGDEGCCAFVESKIYVNRCLPVDRWRDVLVHELLHAIFFAHGIDAVLNIDRAVEERIVSVLAPALVMTLDGHEMLRIPKIPGVPKARMH